MQDALTCVEVKDDALLVFHLFKSHCSVSAEFERETEVKDFKATVTLYLASTRSVLAV